jgi:hemerythrin-like domain-containing protein
MSDVFDVLAEDHEDIGQMLAELEKGPTAATGATEDQLMLRKMMTEELIVEASRHEEFERAYFWPTVREHVPGGGQLTDRAICQELEIGELLAGLDRLDASEPEFEDLLGQFTRAGREHFDFEERHVWPRLRAALTQKAANELGRKILQGRKTVPVLPTPRASAAPGGNAHHGSFG